MWLITFKIFREYVQEEPVETVEVKGDNILEALSVFTSHEAPWNKHDSGNVSLHDIISISFKE